MAEELKNIDQIFWDALQIESVPEREAFLQKSCGDDEKLRRTVQKLINAQPRAERFLAEPFRLGETAEMSGITERPGTVIGSYKLLQQLGEGGMGIVFMAEQSEPIQRTVALKIINPGMDTRQVIARFEAERQALAMMDHPNIAKVLDAGATDSGRPYFVMELVKGVPITKYCDDKQLSLRERLDLFKGVCHAVQHAHQKGIIHRDIKPTNVLVAEYDNHAVPKVIDFGVAKATAQKLTERTMFTEFGQVVGTVEYMSPEQAKLNQLDVDTRSDIYSLGVLLYELLTGSTPFEQKRLREAAFDEALRIIREEEPPRPSTRVTTLAQQAATTVSAQRGSDPHRLSLLLQGELDWIVMKALEKDRNRRYETASGFAGDVARHLHDEPVEAGPPSAAYRFRKFVRRNKSALATATALALAVLVAVGSIGSVLRDRSARQAKLNDGVELAVHDASTARDRALTLTDNRPEWQALLAAALGALQRAEELAGQDRAALDPDLRQRLQALRARSDADETDRQFVASFDDVLVNVIVWDARRSQFKSEEAFLTLKDSFKSYYGLDLGATPVAEVGSFLQQRPRPIQAHLLVALHVCLARVPQDDQRTKRWLADVLQAADGDAWRKQARDALARSEWPTLEKLLKEVTVTQQPPALLLLLSSYLPGDAWSTKHDLVLKIQQSYPSETVVSRFATAQTYDILAWNWADDQHQNTKRAVELAKRAVRLAPKDGDFWNTMGVAYYRAGNWTDAVAALETARELSKGGDAVDWLFLAMAHWRLGHKDEARKWYDQAIRSPQTSTLLEAELPRFRAEAAKLLGIEN